MQSKPLRIITPLAILLLFYWAIYISPNLVGSDTEILNPEQARDLLDESRLKISEKKYEEALKLTRRLNKAFPKNHIYLEQLAKVNHYLARYLDEAECWNQYIQYSPTPLDACPHYSDAYRALNLINEMHEACKICYDLDQRNVDSIFFLALSYERLGQPEKARELYAKGVEIDPVYTDLRIGLARVNVRLGNLAKAKELIAKVYEESPDNVDGLLVMGLMLRAEGRANEAKTFLAHGAELSPRYTDFYVVLASIAEQQGNRDEALTYYDKILEQNPDNRDIEVKRQRLLGG